MGWDGTHHRNRTKEQFIHDELTGWVEIVQFNWKGNTYFAAAMNPSKPGKVFALVILVSRDGDYWMKKVMDETCGPYHDGASQKVMQALSPLEMLYEPGSTTYQWAKEWRDRQRNRPAKINTGSWYVFAKPIKFTNGMQETTFRKVEGVNRWETQSGQLVRFSAAKAGDYKPHTFTPTTAPEQARLGI